MDADRALKKVFGLRAAELLVLTGDRGARVVSRQVPEVAAVSRRLDFVMKLRHGREVYLRHLEFQMRYRRALARRVFEYAAALAAARGLPVVSTLVVLRPRRRLRSSTRSGCEGASYAGGAYRCSGCGG